MPCVRAQENAVSKRDPATTGRNCNDYVNNNFCPLYDYYGIW